MAMRELGLFMHGNDAKEEMDIAHSCACACAWACVALCAHTCAVVHTYECVRDARVRVGVR